MSAPKTPATALIINLCFIQEFGGGSAAFDGLLITTKDGNTLR